jgi:serine/threonine protein kinase
MNGFPLPDFGCDDDECLDWIGPLSSPHHREIMTEDLYEELCISNGLVVDQTTPIKCTATSTVYTAESPGDGQRWAVKVTAYTRRIAEEYRKRQQIRDCPYLLKSVSLHESPQRSLLQMELCERDLKDVNLEETEIWELIHDIGTALAVIHSDGWMHLDVSPGNILISGCCFKLSDFGTLTRIGGFESGMEGAGPYVSPEALAFPQGPGVTGQTDIFSFGLVLLEAVSRMPAPRGGSKHYSDIRSGQLKLGTQHYPCTFSPSLLGLVNAMIDPDPSLRPKATQLVEIADQVLTP